MDTLLREKTKRDNIILTFIVFILLAFFFAESYFSKKVLTLTQELKDIQQLEKLIIDRETGVRGYIITSNTVFLEPFFNTKRQITDSLNAFKSEAFLKHREILEDLIDERNDFFQKNIQLVSDDDREAAIASVASGKGKKLTDNLRQIMGLIQDEYINNIYLINQRTNHFFEIFLVILVAYLLISLRQNRSTNSKLAKQIIDQNQIIIDKSEQQQKLFAIIGHELRTPAAILKHLIDEEDVQYLNNGKAINTTLTHLLDVLDDMRAISQQDFALQSKPSLISLSQRLESAVIMVDRIASEHNLKVVIRNPIKSLPKIFINAQLLSQITMNLIKNAALYSQGTTLYIIPSVISESDDEIKLSIIFHDNGIGISNDIKPKLFDAFERGASNKDGTRLGLHLSRQYAQKYLGGDLVFLESENGALFDLTITAKKHNVETTHSKPLISLKHKSVLLAEDNKTIRMITEILLLREGCTVTAVDDGIKALEAFDDADFDFVLSDIFMPNMDGFELTKTLRQRGYKNPIFGITASSIGEEIQMLIDCGADKSLIKPLTIEALQEALTEYESRQPKA